jgi:hypothetical protein
MRVCLHVCIHVCGYVCTRLIDSRLPNVCVCICKYAYMYMGMCARALLILGCQRYVRRHVCVRLFGRIQNVKICMSAFKIVCICTHAARMCEYVCNVCW